MVLPLHEVVHQILVVLFFSIPDAFSQHRELNISEGGRYLNSSESLGVLGEEEGGEHSSLWCSSAAQQMLRQATSQPHNLGSVQQLVSDPGDHGHVHLNSSHLLSQQ